MSARPRSSSTAGSMVIATWLRRRDGCARSCRRPPVGPSPCRGARPPRAAPSSARSPSSSTSSGSISRSSGSAPDASSSSARREPVGVVVVRADQGELEHDHAVVVDPRQLVAGADEDERARVVELVERRFGGTRVPGALERERCTARRPAGPSARWAARRARPPAPRRPRARARRRGGAGSDTVMSLTPCGAEHRGREQPDRAATGHEHPIVRGRTREVHGVHRDRGRLGERGRPGREPVGDPQQRAARHRLVPAERAAEPEVVGRLPPQAHRRAATRHARHSPQPGVGVGDDPGAELPARRRPRRARRPCRPTRDRAPNRGARTARARGGGRCRRSRSARPRPATSSGPGRGRATACTAIAPSPV